MTEEEWDHNKLHVKLIQFDHINCRSLYRKLDEIICIYRNYDFIACTETWLTETHTESMLSFPGKTLFRLDPLHQIIHYLKDKIGVVFFWCCVIFDTL